MDTTGKHLIIDFYNCNADLINNANFLLDTCIESVKLTNATILETHVHKFEPQGISVVIILQESHLSLHSFPEEEFVSVDIYSCGEYTDPYNALDYMKENLQSKQIVFLNLLRGNGRKIVENRRYGTI